MTEYTCNDCGGELDPLYPHVCDEIAPDAIVPAELKEASAIVIDERDAGYSALDAWRAYFIEQGMRTPRMDDLIRLGMTNEEVSIAAGVIRRRLGK